MGTHGDFDYKQIMWQASVRNGLLRIWRKVVQEDLKDIGNISRLTEVLEMCEDAGWIEMKNAQESFLAGFEQQEFLLHVSRLRQFAHAVIGFEVAKHSLDGAALALRSLHQRTPNSTQLQSRQFVEQPVHPCPTRLLCATLLCLQPAALQVHSAGLYVDSTRLAPVFCGFHSAVSVGLEPVGLAEGGRLGLGVVGRVMMRGFLLLYGDLVVLKLPVELLLRDGESQQLLLVCVDVARVLLDAPNKCVFAVEEGLLLPGALLLGDFVANASLDLLDLLLEGRDVGEDGVELGRALVGDVEGQLLVQTHQLLIALLVERTRFSSCLLPAASLKQFRFFHIIIPQRQK